MREMEERYYLEENDSKDDEEGNTKDNDDTGILRRPIIRHWDYVRNQLFLN